MKGISAKIREMDWGIMRQNFGEGAKDE